MKPRPLGLIIALWLIIFGLSLYPTAGIGYPANIIVPLGIMIPVSVLLYSLYEHITKTSKSEIEEAEE